MKTHILDEKGIKIDAKTRIWTQFRGEALHELGLDIPLHRDIELRKEVHHILMSLHHTLSYTYLSKFTI